MNRSNTELVMAAQSGDQGAFAHLVERTSAAVAAAAYARTANREAARDITQETFIAAFTGIQDLKDPGKFGLWLMGIATRKAISWVRRQGVEHRDLKTRTEAETRRERPITPYAMAETNEAIENVLATLNTLEDADREIILLRYLGEQSRKDTAAFLDISPEAVDKRLQRALARLRTAMTGSN